MALTDSLLIVAGTFVLVVVALTMIIRLGLQKEFKRNLDLREEQLKSLELSWRQTQETRDRMDQLHQRNQQAQLRNDEVRAKSEELQQRSEKNLDRWEAILSKIEVIVERLDRR
jgi:hypothetical protein